MSTPFGDAVDRAIKWAVNVLAFLVACAYVAWLVMLLVAASSLYPPVLGMTVGCLVMARSVRTLLWHWPELGPYARLSWILLYVGGLAAPPLLDGLFNGAPDPRPYVGVVVVSLLVAVWMELEVRRQARRRRLRPVNDGSAGAPRTCATS